jgi:hypothetical protein
MHETLNIDTNISLLETKQGLSKKTRTVINGSLYST